MAVTAVPNPGRFEYEQATKDLQFTKDFNPAIEAVMRDELEPASVRVLAWLKRRAWGNFSLYCIGENGQPLYQCDCAAELGIDKGYVSKTMQYLEKRGYLERRGTAKMLYPVLNPVLGRNLQDIVKKLTTWSTFLEEWKVAHVDNFSEYEVAYATYERIKKVLLADYRKWKASKTNGGALNKEESLERTESQSVSPLSVNDQDDRTDPTDLTPILQAFEQIGQTGIDDQEAEQILALTQEAAPELALTPEDVAQAVIDRGTNLSSAIKSPVRFLRADIPRFVKSQTFQARIATQRSRKPAQTPCEYESPPPADEDPVVSTRQCGKCGGTVDIYQSGNEGFCRCAIGRLAAARGMP